MAFQRVPSTIEIVLQQTMHGEPLVNVLHCEHPNSGDGIVLANMADEVIDWWGTELAPNLSEDITLTLVTCRDLDTEGGQISQRAPATLTRGGFTGPATSSNVALVCTHRTSRAGRSYRGRTYVAGLAEEHVTGNAYDLTRSGNIQDAFNDLRSRLDIMSGTFGVVSRWIDGQLRSEAEITAVVNSVVRDTRVDSQRRRLPA
jgi:hypothetical protein